MKLGNRLARERLDLRFGGRNDRVGMIAEQHAAKPLACEERGRGAIEPHGFQRIAALALELGFRQGGIAREISDETGKLCGEFGKAVGHNPARVRAGARAEIGANAA